MRLSPLVVIAILAGSNSGFSFELKHNEFGTIAASKIVCGDADVGPGNLTCPCYVADWAHGSAYSGNGAAIHDSDWANTRFVLRIPLNG